MFTIEDDSLNYVVLENNQFRIPCQPNVTKIDYFGYYQTYYMSNIDLFTFDGHLISMFGIGNGDKISWHVDGDVLVIRRG